MNLLRHWTEAEVRPRCQHCPHTLADERSFMCSDCAAQADDEVQTLRDQFAGAVERAEKAEAELAKVEAILVAADRVREAYDAMLDGRKLGRLPDFEGQ